MKMENMQSNIIEAEPFVDGYLLYLMAQASAAVSAAFHRQIEEQGIPVWKWRILASLYPEKQLKVGQLAQKCLAKQPTLTRQLDRLCREGLTRRGAAKADRRGVVISLTQDGKMVAEKLISLAREHEADVLKDYSEGQIETLKSMLEELRFRASEPR